MDPASTGTDLLLVLLLLVRTATDRFTKISDAAQHHVPRENRDRYWIDGCFVAHTSSPPPPPLTHDTPFRTSESRHLASACIASAHMKRP